MKFRVVSDQPVPRPAGSTRRSLFIVGAVGALMTGISAAIALLVGFDVILLRFDSGALYSWLIYLVWVINYPFIALAVGMILLGLGFLGFRINYGFSSGTAAFAFSLVAAVTLFVSKGTNIAVLMWTKGLTSHTGLITTIINILATVMFGVAQVFWGIAHRKARHIIGNARLGLAAGILCIISGVFAISILFYFYAIILFLGAVILSFIVFVKAKVPFLPPEAN